MIHIFIELRYQRQLNRICPEVLENFFSSIVVSVQKNGGKASRLSSCHLFQFEDESVGYAFASSRVIADIHDLLEEHRTRIKEYFILVDYSGKPVSPETFSENLAVYESILTPDEGILLTQAAAAQLGPYLFCQPLPETKLSLYSGPRVAEAENTSESKGGKNRISLSLYTDYVTDPVSLFRNLVCTCPVADTNAQLNDEELALFAETRHAMDMYGQCRFSSGQPDYRISACLEYLELFFRTLKASPTKCVPVTMYGSKPLPPAFDSILDIMGEQCDFSALNEPVFLPADLKNMPEDLLDLAYLVYRSIRYLYIDELTSFFVFLGKQADFLESLGAWLHSYGILADAKDFRSLNPVLFSKIGVKLGDRKNELNRHLARFLWYQYEHGYLQPVFALFEVLADLGFAAPDSFLVNTLYHVNDIETELAAIRDRFKNPELADAVQILEAARKKYDEGSFDESSVLVKDVLHTFQKETVLAGEYRALSLIAMLSLARNNGDDSVVYLEYALDNAERMHDSSCVISTTFDMAIVHFIIGNFHFAMCALDNVEKLVVAGYAKDREVSLLFMKGRIAFELGNYRNAELLFQTAASLASVHQIPESVALCRVWYARSLAHQNRYASAENILASCAATIPEAYIFLLESGLISGHTVAGIAFPESIAELFTSSDRWSSEKFLWKSGFAIAEDRCYGTTADTRIAVRMYEVFSRYYHCRFGQCNDIPGTVSDLAQIARSALEAKDPYAAIYYYICYDMGIKSDGVLPADTTTFLSRGFKYMQRRANEIEENSIREQFMQHPTWNSRLYRTARDNMLI